jgi:NitT/TauT family transport system substrate-binding protein
MKSIPTRLGRALTISQGCRVADLSFNDMQVPIMSCFNGGSSLLRMLLACVVAITTAGFAIEKAAAETVKLGLLKVIGSAPIFVAQEKGYFADEGLNVELNYFTSGAEPIAVAVASGGLDVAFTGLTAGFYNLGGQGALRILAGTYREAPGFRIIGYVASNRAFAAGLKSLKDLPNHSIAVTQVGAFNYALGRLTDKYGFEPSSVRMLPLQSIPNVVSAITGNQADAAMITATAVIPMVQRGDAKLLGWVGDETPWQQGAIVSATKTANDRHDMLVRFLRAYRRSARDYHDAFAGADEKRRDGPGAADILAVTSKYLGLPSAQIALGIAYVDADARLDVKDVARQIEWYKSHGFIKGDVRADQVIDKRYVVQLPEH